MRKIKKAVACLLAVLLVLSTFPTAFTASAVFSGDCGDSLWWEYDPNTLTLTVSGSGLMENFYYTYTNDYRLLTTAPWERFFDTMQNVVIGPFVTEISQYAFAGCIALESVTAGESVMDISDFAFYDCINLSSVTLDNNVGRIGTVAFANCCALTNIIIPDRVLYIEDSAFIDCSGLSSVTIPAGVTRIGHNAFSGCPALADVYYNGTQEQWNAIQIGVNNAPLLGATLHTAPLPVDSGTCGDNLTWAYDPNTFTLTVSGTGAMYDYSTQNANGHYLTTAPWREHADELKSVVIENSVTSIGYAAFLYCDELTDVTIGSGVETIGGSAFGYCKKLANVTIGSGVTTIDPYAFGNCDGLTSVVISESVTSIGNGAFGYCVNLTDVTILAVNCTQMGNGANNTVFKGCTALQKVTIGNAVTTIPDNAFRACTSLTELSIGSSVTSIGSAAFYHCSGLTEVDIPSSVTSIGDYAFYCCSSLPGVTIPNGVTGIGDYAFYFCTGFTCISIPDSVTVIGKNAFARCSNLTSVVIPDSVTSIDNSAFSECTGLADVYYTGTQQQWSAITIGLYNNPLLNATLHVNYLPVTSGTCGDSLTWVYDLNTFTLTVSGTGAMYDYSIQNANGHFLTTAPWQDHQQNIQSVVINSGVTTIGAYAFCECSAITDITIGGDVTSIGDRAFRSCTGLTGATIPNSVTSIGDFAFFDCAMLTSVTFGSGVTSIGEGAFCDCTALTSVTIPDSVIAIGPSAFCNCDELTSVTIPNGAANIELSHHTFESCDSLTSVAIGSRVTSIGYATFLNCSRLTSVTIPNSVTSIDNYAFEGCSALTGVTIPDSVTSIGVGAFNYSGLTSVTIGSGVTSISEDVFGGCSALTSVTIPDSVTSIGVGAFYGCSALTGVTIPDSVTSIDNSAFCECTGLADVYYTGTQQQWNAITIGENNDPLLDAALHVNYLPVTSGTCGDSLTWVYDLNTFTLTVSGTGAMYDYSSEYDSNGTLVTSAPWQPYCQTMQTLLIVNDVTSIGELAFAGCTKLVSVTIPNSVTSIGIGSFIYSGLTSLTIPDSVTSIGAEAFSYCTGLTSVTVGSGVTSIGNWVFDECTALKTISVSADNAAYSSDSFGVLYNKNKTELVMYPIGNTCTSFIIPDTVTFIGGSAFFDCTGLTSVTIPNSVTGVDAAAFFGCTGLADVYYTGTQQQWSAITIGENNDPLLDAALHLHEHTYTANVTTPATCTQDGVMTYTCACGDAYTEPIAATGHTPQTVVTVPATCTETGLQHEECESCGERLGDDEVIPANGHTVGAWQMIEDPTPTSTGRMCQYCAVCGALLDEMTVPMLAGTHVTGVALSSNEEYLNTGEFLTLTAAVTPETATNKAVLWTSSKPGVATVENGVVTPVAPGITVIIAQTVDNGYKDFCVVQVNAVTPQNGAVLDNGMIYGLSVNTSDLTDCLNLDDETMFIKTDSDVIGTGTKVYVMQGDTVINEFETVIFGDIDGNAWYDGTDAYFVSLVANGMVSEDALSDAQRLAADCNHDGSIDRNDVALLEQAGLLFREIDQNAAPEEREADSLYLEYCSLIEQTIEVEPEQPVQTAEPLPAAEQASLVSRILSFLRFVVAFINCAFFVKVV